MRISDWSSDVCSSDLESGQIPISVAVEIAEADDQGIQQALQRAYETNLLRGRKLLIAKKIVEQRRRQGKGLRIHADSHGRGLSADALVRAYQQESDRKRMMIRDRKSTRLNSSH